MLFAHYTTRLSYYDDWLDAFSAAPEFAVTSLDISNWNAKRRLQGLVKEAELVVLLHSTNGDTTTYLDPLATILQERKGLLLSFVGNEVNLPGSPIAAKRRVFSRIEPDIIATQLLAEAGEHLFGDLARSKVISLPHALNTEVFRPGTPQRARPIDVGVRAARYPPHLGDDDRNRLHDFFHAHAFDPALNVDIGSQRLNRKGWADFLERCRATVSSEAGSWYLERDDSTVEAIRAYVTRQVASKGLMIRNDSPLRRLGHKLPWPIRAALHRIMGQGPLRHESTVSRNLPFDEIFERFFAGRPRCPVYSKCISSRHFDAIGAGTVQILLNGRYNDILVPDRHFIALAPDYSNIDDVMERFADVSYRETMANEALQHVMAEHTYGSRMSALRMAVEAAGEAPDGRAVRERPEPKSRRADGSTHPTVIPATSRNVGAGPRWGRLADLVRSTKARFAIFTLTTVIGMAFALNAVDLGKVIEALGGIEPAYAGLTVVLLLFNFLMALARFRSVLGKFGHFPAWRQVIAAFSFGSLGNQFVLNIIGQSIGRAHIMHSSNISFTQTVIVTFVERVLAFGILALASIFAIWVLMPRFGYEFKYFGGYFLALAGGMTLAVLTTVMIWYLRGAAVPISAAAVRREVVRFLPVALLTLVVHLFMLAGYLTTLLALGMEAISFEIAAAVVIVMFGAALPVSLSGWGVREITAVAILGTTGLTEPSIALAAAIIMGILSLATNLVFSIPGLFLVNPAIRDATERHENSNRRRN